MLLFDLSVPIEVIARTRLPSGTSAYRVRICADKPEIDAGTFTLKARGVWPSSPPRTR